jgi:hypothetical protein
MHARQAWGTHSCPLVFLAKGAVYQVQHVMQVSHSLPASGPPVP